jgi:hypothetical protein
VFINEDIEDIFIWGPSIYSTYTTKSAYSWVLDNTALPQPSLSWSWIWKLKLPNNICHFVWIILHNSLPTNYTIFTHHIFIDVFCYRCDVDLETIIHTLRDCPQTHQVWSSLCFLPPLSSKRRIFFFGSRIILSNLKVLFSSLPVGLYGKLEMMNPFRITDVLYGKFLTKLNP